MNKKKTVVVGMSGGVDSSVSALLLKEEGYDVIGLFMKNWEEKDERGVCKASLEYEDVLKVCDKIGIPCYSVEFTKEYQENVFKHFLEGYKKGYTPNPDILCNREIKFHHFLNKALSYGADYLATGHYVQNISIDGKKHLVKGKDPGKDQSYFLYTLKESILEKVLFPIGNLQKSEVRAIAKKHDLITHDKKDSTGICFIGKRAFKPFLSQFLKPKPGPFMTLEGKQLGVHDGISFYTIGQRKGLGVGGEGDAWYVVGKDINKNIVYIEQGKEHPALYADMLYAEDISWVNDSPPFPLNCTAKVRYRQMDEPCSIHIQSEKIKVVFKDPQRAITIGQSVVFYKDQICLGGAIISEVGPTHYTQNKEHFLRENFSYKNLLTY